MSSSAPGGREPGATDEAGQRRHARYRRAVWIGMAVSAVIHLALVAVVSRGLFIPPATAPEALTRRPLPPEGMRVVRTRSRPTPPPVPAPEEPQPTAREEPEEEEEEEPAPAPAEEAEPAEEEAPLSNADRLQVREGDPRIWAEPGSERGRTLDGMARADSALRAAIRSYLDSLQLTEEQREAARDWTFGEGDRRWGISPEGLHLGNVTIPLPLGQLLQPPGPLRRQLERELRYRADIQRQEALRRAEEVRGERLEEMRERSREEADDASEADSTSSGGG